MSEHEHKSAEELRRERLGEAQVLALEQLRSSIDRLRDVVDREQEQPDVRTLVFTAAEPTQRIDRGGRPAGSVSVLNPTSVEIRLGIGSGATATSRAISVPPRALLTLPVSSDMLELAAPAADLATGDAVVYAFLYRAVQPAFLGEIS